MNTYNSQFKHMVVFSMSVGDIACVVSRIIYLQVINEETFIIML